jgi:class 3 adenylate cyclase
VERRIWTAIGNTVNLAARLQQLTRSMDAAIAIDGPTWRGARYVAADFVRHARTPIRGRSEPEDVWLLPTAAAPDRRAS